MSHPGGSAPSSDEDISGKEKTPWNLEKDVCLLGVEYVVCIGLLSVHGTRGKTETVCRQLFCGLSSHSLEALMLHVCCLEESCVAMAFFSCLLGVSIHLKLVHCMDFNSSIYVVHSRVM